MLCRDRATERKPVRGKKEEIVTFSCKLLLDSDEHLVRNVAEIVRIQDVLVVPSHILFLVLSLNISHSSPSPAAAAASASASAAAAAAEAFALATSA